MIEASYLSKIVGVDEVGRGPLAGPVVAAAVILDETRFIDGITDSKKISPKRRETIAYEIKNCAREFAIGVVEAGSIDNINIHQASLLAMKVALGKIKSPIQLALIDGKFSPETQTMTKCIIKGDDKVRCIAAASILAKVYRDQLMMEFDALYPEYGFAGHKGYPTKAHIDALNTYGPCPLHRRSYAPVRKILESKIADSAS